MPTLENWQNQESNRRRALLAMIHIAKKELRFSEEQYGAALHGFGVESAADLSIQQMENLVKAFKHWGWKPIRIPRKAPEGNVVKALQERIREEIVGMERGEIRLGGIAKKVFGVDNWTWIREPAKLRRLLAILRHVKTAKGIEHRA